MSWAAERLAVLRKSVSYRKISEETGIPISTISYTVREQRVLPAKYTQSLRNYYSRNIYKQLRDVGMSPQSARRYRWFTPSKQMEFIQEADDLVNQLVDYRMQQQIDYMRRQGTFVSEADTRSKLYDWIREGLGRYPVDRDDDYGKNSPSLRHIIGDDK